MQHDKKFLNDLLGRRIDVYLVNGIKLSGNLDSYLPLAVVLGGDCRHAAMLVYKHAISTITEAR